MSTNTPPQKKMPCKTEDITYTRSCTNSVSITFRPIGRYSFHLVGSRLRRQQLLSSVTNTIIHYN